MKNFYIFLFFTFSLLFFSACELYNPAEPVPAYIHIEKISVNPQPGQGTSSSKIADAWVYIDEQLIGCFELPVTFPVIKEGTHVLKIRAGVKVNGISATRSPYPFFDYHEQLITLKAGEKQTVTPVVKYLSSARFTCMEDFESSTGTFFQNSPSGTDTSLLITSLPNQVFEGSKSGIAYLIGGRDLFECASDLSNRLNFNGATGPIFLEFNYKCNYIFAVGLFCHTVVGTSTTNTVKLKTLDINPSSDWNKIYVYLTPTVL
ncbi:MAG: hypothetical protein JNL69_12470, partial [Bacteroidia bacterium]|nr:hypothetical protein [Bacteroidia bacterium]